MMCKIPPPGWHCTRNAPHDGPCAAVPDSREADIYEQLQWAHADNCACNCKAHQVLRAYYDDLRAPFKRF